METLELVKLIVYGSPAERQHAAQLLTAESDRATHYAGLFAGLGATTDSRIDFWCLDLLWKEFKPELQQHADQAIPLLLKALVNDKLQVLDRTFLVLMATGSAAVEALLQASSASDNPSHTATYLFALCYCRGQLYWYAKPVLALLAVKLADPYERVRWAAMTVLMDISPLRPWFDERMSPADFAPLYELLLTVADGFVLHTQDEWASRYADLLRKHLAK